MNNKLTELFKNMGWTVICTTQQGVLPELEVDVTNTALKVIADEIAIVKEEVKAQGLTQKQWAVLDFYSNFYTENGYYPTLEVVRESFGYANTSSVQRHTDRLKQKGYLKKIKAGRLGEGKND